MSSQFNIPQPRIVDQYSRRVGSATVRSASHTYVAGSAAALPAAPKVTYRTLGDDGQWVNLGSEFPVPAPRVVPGDARRLAPQPVGGTVTRPIAQKAFVFPAEPIPRRRSAHLGHTIIPGASPRKWRQPAPAVLQVDRTDTASSYRIVEDVLREFAVSRGQIRFRPFTGQWREWPLPLDLQAIRADWADEGFSAVSQHTAYQEESSRRPTDCFLLVTRGRLEVTVGNTTHEMREGTQLLLPARALVISQPLVRNTSYMLAYRNSGPTAAQPYRPAAAAVHVPSVPIATVATPIDRNLARDIAKDFVEESPIPSPAFQRIPVPIGTYRTEPYIGGVRIATYMGDAGDGVLQSAAPATPVPSSTAVWVSVLEAFGLNVGGPAYVEVEVGELKFRSGGSEGDHLSWNQRFKVDMPKQTEMIFTVVDEQGGLIGAAAVDLGPPQQPAELFSVALARNGVEVGSLHIQLEICQSVWVTVHKAENFGAREASLVFAELQFVGSDPTFVTTAQTGPNPIWQQTFELDITGEPQPSVKLTLRDENEENGRMLGWVVIPVDVPVGGSKELRAALSPQGNVWVGVHSQAPQETSTIWVTVNKASGIVPINNSASPVAVLQIKGTSLEAKTSVKTDTVDPVWDEVFKLTVTPGDELVALVLDGPAEDAVRLGEATIPLHLPLRAHQRRELALRRNDTPVGKIQLTLQPTAPGES